MDFPLFCVAQRRARDTWTVIVEAVINLNFQEMGPLSANPVVAQTFTELQKKKKCASAELNRCVFNNPTAD